MPNKSEKSFNSRTFQGQVERELIFGGVLVGLVFGGVLVGLVVGGGLIWLFWGIAGLFTALLLFLGFWLMVGLIWGFLKLLEIVSRD